MDKNKTKLFSFLAHVTSFSTEDGRCHGSNVLSSLVDADLTNLVPCFHEEVDTRLLLQMLYRRATEKYVCILQLQMLWHR